jgi:hypothetical protein
MGETDTPMKLSYIMECLSLRDGGVLVWKKRPRSHFKNSQVYSAWNTKYSEKPAGNVRPDGYIIVRINGVRHLLHRLVFAIHHGLELCDLPDEVDHKSKDCTNNDPDNLRPSTHMQNLYNTGTRKNNTSGFKGVSWESRYKHWEARIRAGGKRYHLGYFTTPEAAHEAYAKAANDLHCEFARTA